MREGWEIKTLGEVCDISAGQGAPQGEDNYCLDGTPFIKAGNLEALVNGEREQSVQKVSKEVALSHRLVLQKKGSIVFAKSGMSCMKGYVYTLQQDCYVVSHLAILFPKSVSGQYLNYALHFFKPSSLAKDASFPSITLKDLAIFPIPFPTSLQEQLRIVDILDREFAKIDALKANAEKSLQSAKDLFQATLKKELEPKEGWKTEKIGEVFEITDFVSNGSFASLRENVKYHNEPNYAVLVRLVDNSNGFDPNKFVYLDEHGYNFLAKSKLFGGELIMCNIGATIGTTFICPDLGMPMSIGPNSLLIRTPDNVFFNYYLQSQSFKKKLKGIIAKTTLEKFNKTQFKELVISFPEGQERKGIVSRLENLCAKSKTLQENYQKTLALCDDLKQALLRKAFNGEL